MARPAEAGIAIANPRCGSISTGSAARLGGAVGRIQVMASHPPADLGALPMVDRSAEPSSRNRRLRTVLIAMVVGALVVTLGLPQLGLWGNPGCGLPVNTCTRVLFIGDSYTYVNDLPTTFADLAWSAGYRVDAVTLANGGESLAGHVADPATSSTIRSGSWNWVVLQDQSEDPAVASYRASEMDPAVAELAQLIRNSGATPLLFLTWGHESGWSAAGLDSYVAMQDAVDQGYLAIASELAIPIAPVGDAWQALVDHQADTGLWQSDGVHPTVRGTYLAACVFFESIFGKSPVGLSYRDGLSDAEASLLQHAAVGEVAAEPAA